MTTDNKRALALEALKSGDLILAPNHTHKCGSSHDASCSCGAVEKMAPLIKAVYEALQAPDTKEAGGEVKELLRLLDILLDKSGKYHDALGGTCTEAEDSEAVVKSWSESREVALINVENFLHKNRKALQREAQPAPHDAWRGIEPETVTAEQFCAELYDELQVWETNGQSQIEVLSTRMEAEAERFVDLLARKYPNGLKITAPPKPVTEE
jgi:hypothetical protein